jgi:hypothetical protein
MFFLDVDRAGGGTVRQGAEARSVQGQCGVFVFVSDVHDVCVCVVPLFCFCYFD